MVNFWVDGSDQEGGMGHTPEVPKMCCVGHSNITVFSFIGMFPPTATLCFYNKFVGQEIKDYSSSCHRRGDGGSEKSWGLG